MNGVVWVNDVDLHDLGFAATALPGWADGIAVNRDLTEVAGRVGVVGSAITTTPARVIQIQGLVRGEAMTDRRTALRAIRAHCIGTVQLRFGDAPDQYIEGYLSDSRATVQRRATEFTPGVEWLVTLQFTCPDPAFYDVQETTIEFGSTPVGIPIGNLPLGGVVRIAGPATSPVLQYHDGLGAIVEAMTFTGSLGAGEWWDVDLSNGRITDAAGDNALGAWGGLLTGEAFITPSPHDGVFASELWPAMSVTSGAGSYTYRRAYSE